MRLPWTYKPNPNPWDERIGLSGYFPGQAGPMLDLFAMMTTLARLQWETNEDYGRALHLMKWQSRVNAIAWIIVMASTWFSLGASKGWW